MDEKNFYLPRSRSNDRMVVKEMLRDRDSSKWNECYVLVRRLVQLQAHNIPTHHWDDLVQEAMMRIHKYLPTFQFQCTFKTWIFNIVHSCIIDSYRKLKHTGKMMLPLDGSYDDFELNSDMSVAILSGTVEDQCIIRDELLKAFAALLEYVSLHSKKERNRAILHMVFLENRSLEETAQAVGCSAPVAGYVVRSAQRYVRDKLEYQPRLRRTIQETVRDKLQQENLYQKVCN